MLAGWYISIELRDICLHSVAAAPMQWQSAVPFFIALWCSPGNHERVPLLFGWTIWHYVIKVYAKFLMGFHLSDGRVSYTWLIKSMPSILNWNSHILCMVDKLWKYFNGRNPFFILVLHIQNLAKTFNSVWNGGNLHFSAILLAIQCAMCQMGDLHSRQFPYFIRNQLLDST